LALKQNQIFIYYVGKRRIDNAGDLFVKVNEILTPRYVKKFGVSGHEIKNGIFCWPTSISIAEASRLTAHGFHVEET